MQRMNGNRLAKRIFEVVNSSVRKTNWHHEIEDDLKQAGISKDMITAGGKFRNKIKNTKIEVKEKKKPGMER